jgi:predicted dehydrogenase
MAKLIRWGILGAGKIARKFAADLAYVEDAALVAIGSRTQEAADEFAKTFPVQYRHGSYEALASNPEVDVIYIASPHSLHHAHTLLCLGQKKAVLCEKAFAINSVQVREMIDQARAEGVFLMEALWTKCLPHYEKLMQMIRGDQLGQIRSLLVNFGFIPESDATGRLHKAALGGGTLLDIGIYNVFITLSVLGKPDLIEASMTPNAEGVDEQCAVLFKYRNGAMAQLFSTFCSNLETEADINGDKGRIRLTNRFYSPDTLLEFYPGRPDSKQIIAVHKEPGHGYQFEARHVGDCLRLGLLESPVMSFADSLLLMETMDRIRQIAGIHYPEDAG